MDLIRYRQEEGVVTIWLNRPAKKNAVTAELLTDFDAVLKHFEHDLATHVVVVRGEGRCFCSGADIQDLSGFDAAAMRRYHDLREAVFARLEGFPCPTIAAIEGFALGTGLELALSTDLRVASEDAFLGIPSSRLGIVESYLYMARLVRCLGKSRASLLVFGGEKLAATEARELGLVERVFAASQFDERTSSLASTISKHAPGPMKRSKAVLGDCCRDPYLEHVLDPGSPMIESIGTTEMQAGTNAFLTGRVSGLSR
ncbi:MAG: enoyl-CoA hydratase/isomerase family protein [Deltaproteobacteria bacterium]|nr:enoyl-CoA hydratase/isomerase family protein [Deltaproteobacteria bacterium]